MNTKTLRLTAVLAFATLLSACASSVPDDPQLSRIDTSRLPAPDLSLNIPGLSGCTTSRDKTLYLNADAPVTVIVHGCYGSAARFRALAQVFAFHGQQAVCFNYNDRDSMMKSSHELIQSLDMLASRMKSRRLTVIGHSQGGLIARKALTRERADEWDAGDTRLRLVTISSPFAGIAAADHCASPTARVLSLGLVIPVCKLISGDKWYEITAPSSFIQQPGTLIPQVQEHLKIVTDEEGTCRRRDADGICMEDDYVFSLAEQTFGPVDTSPKAESVEVAAGHAEIVGDYRMEPRKLIALLQRKGVMADTPVAQRDSLKALLGRLYLSP